MELPTRDRIKTIIEQVEQGETIDTGQAKDLVQLIYSLMTPDHTWWRRPPIPPGQIMILANDQTITPPMCFQTQDEANLFAKMNQTQYYIPIPKPPSLDEVQKNPARN